MANYVGAACPWCGQAFTETDDIAVCPVCGTPHHRSCYREHVDCFNAPLHASGFEWGAPPVLGSPSVTDVPEEERKPEGTVCPFCGEMNDPGEQECVHCGQRLPRKSPRFFEEGDQPGRVQIKVDEKIDGVPIKDYLVYLGRNAARYVVSFIRQEDTGSRLGFIPSAFLSPVLFFIYFRMWGYAGAGMLVTVLLNLPSLIVAYFGNSAAEIFGLSMQSWNDIGNACTVVFALLQLVCAVFAGYLLKKEASRAIKKIRRNCSSEEEYARELENRACPSGAFYAFLVLMIFSLSYLLLH